ncbi:hypothetical protein [Lacrimispora sp.]|uniref:hypothetical protein n=1 Tax=Lacrimispora sp. TaxID=2719234 RepID=UPI00346175FC
MNTTYIRQQVQNFIEKADSDVKYLNRLSLFVVLDKGYSLPLFSSYDGYYKKWHEKSYNKIDKIKN